MALAITDTADGAPLMAAFAQYQADRAARSAVLDAKAAEDEERNRAREEDMQRRLAERRAAAEEDRGQSQQEEEARKAAEDAGRRAEAGRPAFGAFSGYLPLLTFYEASDTTRLQQVD